MLLLVQLNGARWWRMEYLRPDTHKKNMLSLGVYPDVSLRNLHNMTDTTIWLPGTGSNRRPGD